MPACEACWERASFRAFYAGGSAADHYRTVLRENEGHHSPEEQAGEGARLCAGCGRTAVHPAAGVCCACGACDHRKIPCGCCVTCARPCEAHAPPEKEERHEEAPRSQTAPGG